MNVWKMGKSFATNGALNLKKGRDAKKELAGENVRDAGLSAIDQMKRVMKGALDRLYKEMNDCFSQLFDIDVKFGFLLNVQRICCSRDCGNLESLYDNLASIYSDDLDGNQLYGEIIHCKMLISNRINVRLLRPEDLLTFIVEYGNESVFPNLRITLQILLIVVVFIASWERSFSKLKLILSYLRSSINQKRLCDLALLSTERDETKKTNFDEIIDEFASRKAQKVLL